MDARRPHTTRIAALAFAALAITSIIARAQSLSSSLNVGVASGSALAGSAPGALLLSPTVRWDNPHTSFDAEANLLSASGARTTGDAFANARFYSPVNAHDLRLELGATAQHIADVDVSEASTGLGADANVSLAIRSGGLWVGGAALASSSATLPTSVRSVSAGTWKRVGSAIFTASVVRTAYGFDFGLHGSGLANPSNPVGTPRDSNSITGITGQYSDLQSTAYWSHGPLALDALLGTRMTVSYGQRATWGRAQASWSLGEQLALVAAGGTHAPEPAIGRVGGNFFSFGVRLASAPWLTRTMHPAVRASASAFGVRADGTSRTIYVRSPGARTVELMADFTNWQPVVMRRAGNDTWEFATLLAPGAHRLDIRVDGGEWTAPPGAGTVRDDFNGVVGLVVVP